MTNRPQKVFFSPEPINKVSCVALSGAGRLSSCSGHSRRLLQCMSRPNSFSSFVFAEVIRWAKFYRMRTSFYLGEGRRMASGDSQKRRLSAALLFSRHQDDLLFIVKTGGLALGSRSSNLHASIFRRGSTVRRFGGRKEGFPGVCVAVQHLLLRAEI